MAGPTESEMMADLAAADAAGDTQLAQHIAGRIKAARGGKQYGKQETAGLHGVNAAMMGTLPLAAEAVKTQGMETVPGSGMFTAEPGIDVPARAEPGPGRLETAQALVQSGQQNPKTALASSVLGALGSPAAAVAPAGLAGRTAAGVGLGAMWGFGSSPAEGMGERLKSAVVPAVAGGVAGWAAPYVGKAIGWAGKKVSGALGDLAEMAGVRSSNADRAAFRRVFGRPADPEEVANLGRFLLQEKVPLRSPQAMKEGLSDILKEEGPRVGALAEQAGKAGATFDLEGASLKALQSPTLQKLAGDTEGRPAVQKVTSFLEDKIAQHGNEVPPQVGHQVRMRLDELAKWDATRPAEVNQAWRAARGAINDELGESLGRAGLGQQWSQTNARYATARMAKDLADVGVERRAGNYWANPFEKLGLLAGGTGAVVGHPAALAVPVAAFALKRGGMPAVAHGAEALSQAIGTPALETASRPAATVAAIRAAALRNRLRLVSAAADEEKEP